MFTRRFTVLLLALILATGLALLGLVPLATSLAQGKGSEEPRETEVMVFGVGVEPVSGAHVIALGEEETGRFMLVWVGPSEAHAIVRALEGIPTPRPMSHDLATTLISRLGAELEKVVITELKDQTYYAQLLLRKDGELYEVDARPSDAIALAVRTDGCKIYAAEALLREFPPPDVPNVPRTTTKLKAKTA